jgi:putative endonuclease
MDRAKIGKDAEDRAAEYLKSQGLEILSRNFRRRLGELDVIARAGDVLIIAEVRTRSSQGFGGAAASVDWVKQRKIVKAAHQLLQSEPQLAKLRVRFDVLVVTDEEVEWIKHAFDARELT